MPATKKQIKLIEMARKRAQKKIKEISVSASDYTGALTTKRYIGGYHNALDDVLLVLNDVIPNSEYFHKE